MKSNKNKVKNILDEITKYEKRNVKKNIEDRLNKTLKLYVNELQVSYERLKEKKHEIIK